MPDNDATTAVNPNHAIDGARLDAFMAARIEGYAGPLGIRQFSGGQSNPTYLLATPAAKYVLRRKPPGKLLPSAHAVDREFRVMRALAGSAVPVPKVHVFSDDGSITGTDFFIMDYVPGRVVGDPALPGFDPAARGAVYSEMAETLAALHGVDYKSAGLGDFGREGDYFARQIHRWTGQYRASAAPPIAAMDSLIAWLPGHVPGDEATVIVHGDFRLGNMIIAEDAPRIAALLDWELSTLGHPLADLAYVCLAYHLGGENFGLGDADPAALGIPAEAEFVDDYCRRTGRAGIPEWNFYLGFSAFRLAAILHGIAGRVAAGTASGADAAVRGAQAGRVAATGWRLVQAGN